MFGVGVVGCLFVVGVVVDLCWFRWGLLIWRCFGWWWVFCWLLLRMFCWALFACCGDRFGFRFGSYLFVAGLRLRLLC